MAEEERPEEFESFEDLTRRLLNVPKSQLDEQLRAEKAKGPQVKTNGPEANP